MPFTSQTDSEDISASGGEMGTLIRRFDWSLTPLGALEGWPHSLRTVVALMLRSPVPIVILWGREGILLYNDGYAGFAGARHPGILGMRALEAWPEVADFNAHVLDVVLGGRSISLRDQLLVLDRHGSPENCWLDLDYSTIVGEDGRAAGVFATVVETTERVRAEQRLRIAQAVGGVGIFEWYPETGRLDASEEFRRIWGFAPGTELSDSQLIGRIHPDDRALAGPSRLGEENPLAYTEYRRLDPETGEIRWIARQGEALPAPEGGRRRYIGVCFDITARKAAEAAQQRSDLRWRSLFEQMQEGFFIGEAVRDAHGEMVDFGITELNPAFETLTGISREQALESRFSALFPELLEQVLAIYRGVLATGEPARYEIEVEVLGGRWFEARVSRLGAETFSVLFLDATLRKRAEATLLQSEAQFRTLAQSLPNHVWTAGPNGAFDWFNDQVYAYGGQAPGELDAGSYLAMVHPEDAAQAAAMWEDALRDRKPYQAEFRMRRHDGRYRWHIARARPFRDESGRVLRWIGTNTDIEDQKAAESALAELAETLEQRVEARTAELARTQDALRHSQKMEALGNLTGGVAHDFNNLLQVVSGNLQLLGRDVAGNPKAEQRIENAMAGVMRGSKLATQLLAFGRRQPLAPKVVNVGRLLRGMGDLLRRTLGDGIEIETVIAGGVWNTLVDPTNVENALLNLAINARDAMDGQGRLTLEAGNALLDDAYARAHPDVSPGQYVMIAVTDTGTGMTPAILEQVFEPFFSTKPQGKGTGLGLSMVYGFVKQSGGHVKVYSEPGQGSTFKLYLPRSVQAEDMPVETEVGPVTGGSETVLVVEDDEAVRETVIALLAELGYSVLKAGDAQSALAVIESGVPIDLLFTDVVMPGPLKSPELARKARERLPQIAVLFTSGYTENSIVHGGRLDEGVNLLSKPYTREALARKVRQVLAQEGRPARPAAPAAREEAPAAARPGSLTVLVCEDDAIIRMDTADMVQELGHTVIEAENGARALEIAGRETIDVLLTDVGLPDIPGGELARRIRSRKPDMAIVFATGRDEVEGFAADRRTALLRKPYRLHMLEQVLGSVLK